MGRLSCAGSLGWSGEGARGGGGGGGEEKVGRLKVKRGWFNGTGCACDGVDGMGGRLWG